MSTVLDQTVVETETHAHRRLLAKAKAEGTRLGRDAQGRYWASSTSTPGKSYLVTAYSCECRGFVAHGHCKHHSALLSSMGWLSEDVDLEPEPTKAPIVELQHTPGAWVDDELTLAGHYRWVQTRTSLLIGGVEEVRIVGGNHDTTPVAIFRPGTLSATDLNVCSTHYDTVIHFTKMLDPDGCERALAAAELFPADEFVEETTLIAA